MEQNIPQTTAAQTQPPQQAQPVQNKPQSKSLLFAVFGIVLFLILCIAGVYYFMSKYNKVSRQSTPAQIVQKNQMDERHVQTTTSIVRWENTGEGGWLAVEGTPPPCKSPYTIQSPSDLSKATSLFPPGQERRGDFTGQGGNYKIHGGFRFDGSIPTDIQVVSPISGYVYRGGNYLVNGEIQYTFDIIDPCGMMVRLGHLKQLSEQFKKMAVFFPAPMEGDSRTERINGFPEVKAGDIVATAIGFDKGPNVFYDLGVVDLRKKNEISQTSAYQKAHADNKELAWHAVCWYDMLPSGDALRIKNLPAGDPVSGKNSDYCK